MLTSEILSFHSTATVKFVFIGLFCQVLSHVKNELILCKTITNEH